MNEISAIYDSYLRAEPFIGKNAPDGITRSPELLRDFLVRSAPQTPIVITGSKGKSSLAHMIAALLAMRGDTGLFTSPHVRDFCERIRINGNNISREDMCRESQKALDMIRPVIDSAKPPSYASPIGILALMACNYFNERKTSYNVFECGRGARFDDVNRIPHKYAVIGSIFVEHPGRLGNDITEIAYDKAHVITYDTRYVYSAAQEKGVLEIIEERAEKCGAKLLVYGRDFSDEGYRTSLSGDYQRMHAAMSVKLSEKLLKEKRLTGSEIDRALSSVTIGGRLEILSRDPLVIMDSAIARESAAGLLGWLKGNDIASASVIMALPDDKDIAAVAETISDIAEEIILTRLYHPHYPMERDNLSLLSARGIEAKMSRNIDEAFELAKGNGLPIVIICANTFVGIIQQALAIE